MNAEIEASAYYSQTQQRLPSFTSGMLYTVNARKSRKSAPKGPDHFDVTLGDQPILTGYIGAVAAVIGPLVIAAVWPPMSWNVFFTHMARWLLLLILVLCLIDFRLQRGALAHLRHSRIQDRKQLLQAALARWLGWLFILLVGLFVYNVIAHYRDNWYRTFRYFYNQIILLWLVAGLPYYLLTLGRIEGRRWNRKDPAVYVCIAFRRAFRHLSHARNPFRDLGELWGSPTARVTLLGVVVKGFFVPLMLTFFLNNSKNFVSEYVSFSNQIARSDAWTGAFYQTAYRLYRLLNEGLFLMDVSLAVIGYLVTTRWLDNGIKSVEQTGLGWLVCVACYKPFNDVMSWYLIWPRQDISHMADTPLKLMAMASIVILLAIYVWGTTAFGLRFSNLTHRGIFTQGPYRYIRHPAYISKATSWWIEHMISFGNIAAVIYMSGWTVIYGLRALTEERHLSADPKYRAYKAHVKYRFVPGLF